MAAIGQTITIVNKSGKVIGVSKKLVDVFNEAKSAYNERKAELRAFRGKDADSKAEERRTRKRLDALTLDDDLTSTRSSRRGSEDGRTRPRRSGSERQRERPAVERGASDSCITNDSRREGSRRSHRPSPLYQEVNDDPRRGELARRYTDGLELAHHSRPSPPRRGRSLDDIDMDLAYGELPPPLPERRLDTEVELRQKMSGLQQLLDECNCLQHSVTAIIDNLQKNPDNLAAVALTLAEISNLAAKLAPGALATMKGSFPAIIALLASPEFAIAIGVGVGVTIIALGGYKIIKKIQAKKEDGRLLAFGEGEPVTQESEMESLREITHIEAWRRGIPEGPESVGTSVDGELITPGASKMLIQEGKLTEADLKRVDSDGKKKKRRHRSSKSETESKTSSRKDNRSGIKVKSKKEASGIRMLFKKTS